MTILKSIRWPLIMGLALAACAPAATVPEPSTTLAPANPFETAFSQQPGVRPVTWGGWIQTMTPGTGASPNADNVVKVNYRGTLPDGTEFDSSYKRNAPATFSLRNVIPCWTNGVPMMKVGEKAKFVCPPSAAYGEAGSPPMIPGGATLVFEIELLDIVR